MMEQIAEVDHRYLLRCNIKFEDLPFKLPVSSIWHDIWGAWCKANYQENLVSTNEVCNQTIWFNSQIRINNTVAYFRNWANGNIMWMKDILSEEGPYQSRRSRIKIWNKDSLH